MSSRLPPIGSSQPWSGGSASEHATCVLARNPSMMTLDGTNTWLIGARSSGRLLVIDPGPLHGGHGEAIASALQQAECTCAGILLTHGHADHSEGAAELAARLRCDVRALDPQHRLGSEGLADGEVIDEAGVELAVVSTPGHTSDSLTFHLRPDGALITGDTLLGRGTTVVAHPDGRLDEYLQSLRRLRMVAEDAGAAIVLPGHGPALADPVGLVDAYLEHRRERLEQVREAMASGASTAQEVVEAVYSDVPRHVLAAALLSVRAQMEFLESGGQ